MTCGRRPLGRDTHDLREIACLYCWVHECSLQAEAVCYSRNQGFITVLLQNRKEKLLYVDYSYYNAVEVSDTRSKAEKVAVLRHALITADREKTLHLLDRGVDWRMPDEEGAEPIHDAALGGDSELVKMLLEMGADPNQKSQLGRTPVCEAVYTRRLGAARVLLEAGADPNVRPHTGAPPLLEAGIRGSLQIMRLLVPYRADPNVTTDYGQRYTALMHAAEGGDVDLVRMLVERGADIEATDVHGKRALMQAAVYSHLHVVAFLLDCGGEVNATDQAGHTALWWANKENPELIRFLLERGARVDGQGYNDRSVIATAVLRGQLDVIRSLLKSRAPLEPLNGQGQSALQAAAEAGQYAVVRLLLDETAADVNYQDKNTGETPLMGAAKSGKAEMIELLLKQGADLSAYDQRKQTALHFAAGKANCGALEVLLTHNAATEEHNDPGYSPLILASSTRSYWKKDGECAQAARVLLDHRAAVDAADNRGWTALFHTAYDGHAQTAQLLIDAGADAWRKDTKGKTPLTIAVGRKLPHPYEDRKTYRPENQKEDAMFDVILVLLRVEGRHGLHWKNRQSLLQTALKWRCPEMVELLRKWTANSGR